MTGNCAASNTVRDGRNAAVSRAELLGVADAEAEASEEIAAATDCSINTALGRMRYGLINLRKLMLQKQIAL